jgi:hypothetical protein
MERRVYAGIKKGGQRAQFVMLGITEQLPQDKRGSSNTLQRINVGAKLGEAELSQCRRWIEYARVAK